MNSGYGGPNLKSPKARLRSTNQVPVKSNGGAGRSMFRFSGANAPSWPGCAGMDRLNASRRSAAVWENPAEGTATAIASSTRVLILGIFVA